MIITCTLQLKTSLSEVNTKVTLLQSIINDILKATGETKQLLEKIEKKKLNKGKDNARDIDKMAVEIQEKKTRIEGFRKLFNKDKEDVDQKLSAFEEACQNFNGSGTSPSQPS